MVRTIEKIKHSFEAGRRGKPDEHESGAAHLIGAHFLELDPHLRFDVRVHGKYNRTEKKPVVDVSGEVSESLLGYPHLETDIRAIVLDHYNRVHRTSLDSTGIDISVRFNQQADPLASNGKAGDIGDPIAVAYARGPLFLPWERYLAVEIRNLVDFIFQNDGVVPVDLAERTGVRYLPGLRADGKVVVRAIYNEHELDRVKNVTIVAQHSPDLPYATLVRDLATLVRARLEKIQRTYGVDLKEPQIAVNPRGAWHDGGWIVDEGNREAKPYRDGFGSHGCVEDSFSGEDPTKPSGTGTFLARFAAVHVVAADLADYARVALSYDIGSDSVDVNVATLGTARIPQEELEAQVQRDINFHLSSGASLFGLCNPHLYRDIVHASDFFHNPRFPWNKPDDKLISALRIPVKSQALEYVS